MQHDVVRVNRDNYKEFLKMIHLRVTGDRYCKEATRDLVKENISYANILDNKSFYVYALKVNDEMVAYIAASVIPKADKRKGTMFIDEVWTYKESRGLGLAKELVNKVMTKAKELDLWEVRLTVDLDNDVARHIYRNFGFKEKECIFGRVKVSD